nr:hypothetical protein KXZ65_04140 [Pectobacterium sp. PL152]
MLYPFNYGDMKPSYYTHFRSENKHLTARLLKVSAISVLTGVLFLVLRRFWRFTWDEYPLLLPNLCMADECDNDDKRSQFLHDGMVRRRSLV